MSQAVLLTFLGRASKTEKGYRLRKANTLRELSVLSDGQPADPGGCNARTAVANGP